MEDDRQVQRDLEILFDVDETSIAYVDILATTTANPHTRSRCNVNNWILLNEAEPERG